MRTILCICGYSISKEPNHKILVVIASQRVRANARPMTAGYDFVISRRDAPELCTKKSAQEGVGNAGCPVHPQPRVQR
jgi:hypothetical protein